MEDYSQTLPKEQVVDRPPKRIRELHFGVLYAFPAHYREEDNEKERKRKGRQELALTIVQVEPGYRQAIRCRGLGPQLLRSRTERRQEINHPTWPSRHPSGYIVQDRSLRAVQGRPQELQRSLWPRPARSARIPLWLLQENHRNLEHHLQRLCKSTTGREHTAEISQGHQTTRSGLSAQGRHLQEDCRRGQEDKGLSLLPIPQWNRQEGRRPPS